MPITEIADQKKRYDKGLAINWISALFLSSKMTLNQIIKMVLELSKPPLIT